MPSDLELRHHISALETLAGVIKSTKTLAAISARQFGQSLQAVDAYARVTSMGLAALPWVPDGAPLTNSPNAACGLLIFGAQRGLCGRFHQDILEQAMARIGALENVRVVVVGQRLGDDMAEAGIAPEASIAAPASSAGLIETIQTLLQVLIHWHGQVSQATMLHAVHGSTLEATALLPVSWPRQEAAWPGHSLPYVAAPQEALHLFLQERLFIVLLRATIHACAAEAMARWRAMQAAQDHLDEQLDRLRNKARTLRQEIITDELLDILSGYAVTFGAGS
jgi:F-type H+-transporting ATPase subunit gamma